MKIKVSVFFSIIFFFVITGKSYSQTGVELGYQTGFYLYGLREVQTRLHDFNYNNPQFRKPYEYNSKNRGLVLTLRGGGKKESFTELSFSNKHNRFEAEGINDQGVEVKRQIISRLNTVSIGAGSVISGRFQFGVSIDIGIYGERIKASEAENFKNAEAIKIFKKQGFLLGNTVHVDLLLIGKEESGFKLRLRPYFQYQILKVKPSYGNDINAFYRLHNAGLCLKIGLN